MGTVNDKLEYMGGTKLDIRDALIEQKQEVPPETPFRGYGNIIRGMKILNAQPKTVNPSTASQTVLPDSEHNALSQVTVNAVTSSIDNNIQSYNIKAGVRILGVEGNVEPDKPDQEKTVNPRTSIQEVTADTGYELAKVTVNPVTASIDSDIVSGNIKAGVNILGVNGKSSVVDTEDSNAVADDIMQNKTAYVNGSKLTGTLNLDTEIANQTALITQLEELVQSKSVIQPVFENCDMSSLNSAVADVIKPVIQAFTNYLDEQQELNIPYLNEPITIYTPDENMQYFIISKTTDTKYRIIWTKVKYGGIMNYTTNEKRMNLFQKIEGINLTNIITINNTDWNLTGYGNGVNLQSYSDSYKSNTYSNLADLINAISNPNSSITYTQDRPYFGISANIELIGNIILWGNTKSSQSYLLDTIVTTKKLSNNVTILPLNS